MLFRSLVAMDDAGLLLRLTAGVVYHGALANMIAVEREMGIGPDAILRLGALAVAVTEDAKRLSVRWRLSNAETKRLDSMGHRWWRAAGMDEATAQRRLYRLGAPRYLDRIMLAWARAGRGFNSPQWRELTTLPQRWTAPVFPLKAADFIARGIAEGPALGHVLTLAEDAWLAMQFPLEEAALKSIADDTVARFARDHRLLSHLLYLAPLSCGETSLRSVPDLSLSEREEVKKNAPLPQAISAALLA